MKSISIILHLNFEKQYFEECLAHIANQTLNCVEIICIIEKLDEEFIERIRKLENCKIVYRDSLSISEIRNRALEVANGKYVLFMDSDGILTIHTLEKLWNICEEKELDILFYSGMLFFEDKELEDRYWGCVDSYYRNGLYTKTMSGKELFVELQNNRDFIPVLGLQIIRKTYLEKEEIHFVENLIDEDEQFITHVTLHAEKAFCINDVLYYRRIRNEYVLNQNENITDGRGYLKTAFLNKEQMIVKDNLEKKVDELNDLLTKQCQIINDLKKSNSYCIGRAVTYPVRIMKRVWKKLKNS